MRSILIWGSGGLALALGAVGLFLIAPPAKPDFGGGKQLIDFVQADEHIRGNAQASVVLVEYGDFECPACKSYVPMLEQLKQEFGDRVAFVYRHFPLRSIHPNANSAAQAAEAAALQGKFWEMHDMLFEKQEEWAKNQNPEELFEEYAALLELDLEQFREAMRSDEVRDRVEDDFQSAVRHGLSSTPTFFLDGVSIASTDIRGYQAFRSLIEQALQKYNGNEPAPTEIE